VLTYGDGFFNANADGSVDSIDPNPSHTDVTAGVSTASLTVTDSTGMTDSTSTVITVGETAPTVTITTPADGDFFDRGQTIPYTVTVIDPEDRATNCARATVTFVPTAGLGNFNWVGFSGSGAGVDP
jgi:cytochrome c